MVLAFWAEPSQLVGGARMNKQNQMSHITAHKLVTGRKEVGKENTCKESCYLYVWTWEDANSAMVFTFIPVLVNLLVNVNNISFLQRKFPVNNTSTPSELHWRTDAFFNCPVIPRYEGLYQPCWYKLCSTQRESYMLRITLFILWCPRTLSLFGYPVKKAGLWGLY